MLPDKLTAITASQAIVAALFARERTGQAQHVRLSMLDAILAFLWASDMGGQTFVDKPVSNQRAASFIDLIYETKDGHMTVSTMTDKEWAALSRAFERPDMLEDERFKTPALRDRNINERLAFVQDILSTRTTADWLARLEAEGVPCAPALTRAEVVEHTQVSASETLIDFDHPSAGRLRQTRTAARFEGTPATVTRGAPHLGEHTDELLAELGLSQAQIADLRAQGVIGAAPDQSGEDKAAAAE